MPEYWEQDCEECGCFGGADITICLDCLKKMTVENFKKLKETYKN